MIFFCPNRLGDLFCPERSGDFSPTRPSGPGWSSSCNVRPCVCLLMSPSHAIFLRGRTGAERASFVDWCDLDLNLDLE